MPNDTRSASTIDRVSLSYRRRTGATGATLIAVLAQQISATSAVASAVPDTQSHAPSLARPRDGARLPMGTVRAPRTAPGARLARRATGRESTGASVARAARTRTPRPEARGILRRDRRTDPRLLRGEHASSRATARARSRRAAAPGRRGARARAGEDHRHLRARPSSPLHRAVTRPARSRRSRYPEPHLARPRDPSRRARRRWHDALPSKPPLSRSACL